jgi:hypothetical protein
MCWPSLKLCTIPTCHDSIQAVQSTDRILVGAKFFVSIQTSPRHPPSLLYNGYRLFPRSKMASAWCWPLLAPRLRMGWSYISLYPLCLHRACHGKTFTFTYISYKKGGKLWTEYCKILWNTTLIPSSIHESHRVQRNLTNHSIMR